uniref:Phlebovirus_G2 domain-containing protein n=1 Tax=Steinernema glaseri TaxID=37863 RepID=A0A1I7ZRR0_9BILA
MAQVAMAKTTAKRRVMTELLRWETLQLRCSVAAKCPSEGVDCLNGVHCWCHSPWVGLVLELLSPRVGVGIIWQGFARTVSTLSMRDLQR